MRFQEVESYPSIPSILSYTRAIGATTFEYGTYHMPQMNE
jgi:hypothetical protein